MPRRREKGIGVLGVSGGLNLTPLLDIIFNLIFFFILATNIRDREQYMEIQIPSATTAEELAVQQQIPVVALTKEGN